MLYVKSQKDIKIKYPKCNCHSSYLTLQYSITPQISADTHYVPTHPFWHQSYRTKQKSVPSWSLHSRGKRDNEENKLYSIFKNFLNVYFFEREGERERERRETANGEGQREGDTELKPEGLMQGSNSQTARSRPELKLDA